MNKLQKNEYTRSGAHQNAYNRRTMTSVKLMIENAVVAEFKAALARNNQSMRGYLKQCMIDYIEQHKDDVQ